MPADPTRHVLPWQAPSFSGGGRRGSRPGVRGVRGLPAHSRGSIICQLTARRQRQSQCRSGILGVVPETRGDLLDASQARKADARWKAGQIADKVVGFRSRLPSVMLSFPALRRLVHDRNRGQSCRFRSSPCAASLQQRVRPRSRTVGTRQTVPKLPSTPACSGL